MRLPNTGVNNTTLKQQNRGLILKLIATGQCSSRIELARRTGLSKMATSNIIGEFIENQVVEEKEKQLIRGKGRNPIRLRISSKAPKLVGIYLYRDHGSVCLYDLTLSCLHRQDFLITARSAPHLMEDLYQTVDRVLEHARRQGERISGIGVGALGPIDVDQGVILAPIRFFGLHDIEIVKGLRTRYEQPVVFDSQYNGAAMAEKYYGRCRDVDDFIYLGISTGIGSGVVSGGGILRNSLGLTSEIGHVSIDWRGRVCGCGRRGCLEAYASTTVVERRWRERGGGEKTYRQICEEADRQLREGVSLENIPVMREVADALICALTDTVNILNPQKIIIGHQGYYLPEGVLEEVEGCLNRGKVSSEHKMVQVEKSAFADEGQLKGCAAGLLASIFSGALF